MFWHSKKNDGHWGKPEQFYVYSKYKGTVWTMLLLAQLGADGDDTRIKKACEFILDISQDRRSGGFAIHGDLKTGGRNNRVIPCLTGNMLWMLIRFGCGSDTRVKDGLKWITKYLRFDDGATKAPKESPYEKLEQCWGGHTCHMGVVKCLKALAEIRSSRRTKAQQNTINAGAEFLLKHHIYKRSHNLKKVAKKEWLNFGYPLMWNDDILEILEILEILLRLDVRDKRMESAIKQVKAKQDSCGRWKMESSFNGRMAARVEQLGKPSKWITMKALSVLKMYYG